MAETPTAGPGRARQDAIYRAGVMGRKPKVPADVDRLAAAAKRSMSATAWAYLGSAGNGLTERANRDAFARWQIVPRMARGATTRDLSSNLLGTQLNAPILLAPVGAANLICEGADLRIGEGAAAAGIPYIFSNQGSSPMEETAAAMGDVPRWFQLYWSRDEDLVDSFIGRAEAMGAGALVVTLDTTMLGWRPDDLDIGSLPFTRGIGIAQYTSDPRFKQLVKERIAAGGSGVKPQVTLGAIKTLLSMSRRHPGGFLSNLRSPVPRASVEAFLDIYSNPGLSWDHLATLKERTRLPILLKGILHPDDARKAVDLGVDGIVVSNHGGRQVDGSIASLDALVDVRAAVGDDFPLVLDSGVRTGADVFKALALGANAVALGRPHIYGLAINGADGVTDVIRNVIAELDLTMALTGVRHLAGIDRGMLREVVASR